MPGEHRQAMAASDRSVSGLAAALPAAEREGLAQDARQGMGEGEPAAGNFLTKPQAEAAAQRVLDEHASSLPDDRRTLRRALDDFIVHSERERGLRASTTAESGGSPTGSASGRGAPR